MAEVIYRPARVFGQRADPAEQERGAPRAALRGADGGALHRRADRRERRHVRDALRRARDGLRGGLCGRRRAHRAGKGAGRHGRGGLRGIRLDAALSDPRLRGARRRGCVCRARPAAGAPDRRLHRASAAARVQVETAGGLPLRIRGKLQSGEYRLPGDVSSQFITGLLFALPLLEGDSEIVLTTPLESKGYIDLTLQVLRQFGVSVRGDGARLGGAGGQAYRAAACTVEGDWSQAALLPFGGRASAAGPVALHGLRPDSVQGDRACIELWRRFGLAIREENGAYIAENPRAGEPFRGLRGMRIDARQIPDMVPALAVTAAFAAGETVICNAARLRIKESDPPWRRWRRRCPRSAQISAARRTDSLSAAGAPCGRQGRRLQRPPRRDGARRRGLRLRRDRHGCAEHPQILPGLFPGFQSDRGKRRCRRHGGITSGCPFSAAATRGRSALCSTTSRRTRRST